jgi:hypothetical protein
MFYHTKEETNRKFGAKALRPIEGNVIVLYVAASTRTWWNHQLQIHKKRKENLIGNEEGEKFNIPAEKMNNISSVVVAGE